MKVTILIDNRDRGFSRSLEVNTDRAISRQLWKRLNEVVDELIPDLVDADLANSPQPGISTRHLPLKGPRP